MEKEVPENGANEVLQIILSQSREWLDKSLRNGVFKDILVKILKDIYLSGYNRAIKDMNLIDM